MSDAAPDRGWAAVRDTALCVRDRWPLHGATPLRADHRVRVLHDPPPPCLVATSAVGLLEVADYGIRRLLDGGWYFGLTVRGSTWYAFERTSSRGRVVRFSLLGGPVRTAVWGLHFGVHQIDVVNDELIVLDTHHNRVLCYDTAHARPRWWARAQRTAYPAGALADGRSSANYAHFNSVFADADGIYLVAHNASYQSGRASELYHLDHALNVVDVRPLGGTSCHNYCRAAAGAGAGFREVFLRSDDGAVVVDGEVVYRCPYFLRGLALGRHHSLVGASEIGRGGVRTAHPGDGRVLVFDNGWRHIGTLVVPGAQVFDVRLTHERDLAKSDGGPAE